MLTLWSLLFPFWTSYHYMNTMAEINFSCKKRSLKHSLYVRQVGQNWSLFQYHEWDFSQVCFKETLKLDLLKSTFGMLFTQQQYYSWNFKFFNTSYWISLDSCISLTLFDPWRTSVHSCSYHFIPWETQIRISCKKQWVHPMGIC